MSNKRRAIMLIRDRPHYRFNSFKAGLERLGYGVDVHHNAPIADLLVVWNRHGLGDVIAKRYEKAGKPVIVAENGYMGIDSERHHLFALALDNHNGAGRWPYKLGTAPADRWERLGIELQAWRPDFIGDVLVLPQRGIGPPGVAMPRAWLMHVQPRIRAVTRRYIRVRQHPGTTRRVDPIEPEFWTAEAAVIWGSGAGLKAIAAGVPTYYEMPKWIGAPAAKFGLGEIGECRIDDAARLAMFHRMAYAQWSAAEIERGEAIERVLACM